MSKYVYVFFIKLYAIVIYVCTYNNNCNLYAHSFNVVKYFTNQYYILIGYKSMGPY